MAASSTLFWMVELAQRADNRNIQTYHDLRPLLVEIVDFLLDPIQFLEQWLLGAINFNPPAGHISELFKNRLLLLLSILQNIGQNLWHEGEAGISYGLSFLEAGEANRQFLVSLFL
jgi:hypothetical protein